jgi:hypothetical protein
VNRRQIIALAIAAANLLLMLLFPPFDQHSIASSKAPIFAGFHFVFAPPPRGEINADMLALECLVVLANAGIAWLLLREQPSGTPSRSTGYQNAILILTGVNLVLMLLFPPFESVFALTNATLPTFEGFYFIFFQKPNHTIVTTLLYIEVIFILTNGALFWLIFKPRSSPELTPEALHALSKRLRGKSGR